MWSIFHAAKHAILIPNFQIRSIRGVHEQLLRLLSSSEQKELRVGEAFSPFAGQNPLQYNPYTEPLWRAAVDQYDRAMGPAEQRIAGKLRNQFRGLEQNSQQVKGLVIYAFFLLVVFFSWLFKV